MPRVARPFVAARLLTVAVGNDGYAFSQSGSTLTAYDYSGATRAATRGTLDVSGYSLWGSQYGYTTSGTTSRSIILTDSSATVGNGSLLFVADDAKLVCWDVSDATAHERTAAAGYHIGGAVFADGYAYWTEVENAPHTSDRYFYVRLMRGRADFSGVSTLATREMDGSTTDGVGADAYKLRRTSTGCWAYVYLVMGEAAPAYDVWLADSGATDQQDVGSYATDGEPRTNGDAVYGSLPYYQAAATGTETALYPSASDGGGDSRNITASGAVYQSYDLGASTSYRWSTDGNGSATEADSSVVLDNAEDVYFYYGS